MAYYMFAPDGKRSKIAPSLGSGDETGNPTVIPVDILKRFHFTFLIRHPRRSIPSYYRTTIPPLREVTGWEYFMPNEAGYEEMVRLLKFLLDNGLVDKEQLTIVDADDLLDNPEKTIRQYCDRIGIDFCPEMLEWTDEDNAYAADCFAKWNGFHEDAIASSKLKARTHAQVCFFFLESEILELAQVLVLIIWLTCRRHQQSSLRTRNGRKNMEARHKR